MKPFPIPVKVEPAGPGSQPPDEDGATLDYMQMPSGMTTFSAPQVPEPEDAEGLVAGKAVGLRILSLLQHYTEDDSGGTVELSGLSGPDLDFVRQLLGEGEVSALVGTRFRAQESVLAGVWQVQELGDGRVLREYVEVAAFPRALLNAAFDGAAERVEVPAQPDPNLFNAPPLLTEINEQLALTEKGQTTPHVINLSLLPHTDEDLTFLDARLGAGDLVILSRGYGNCRIRATRTRRCWWVRYYNSQDTLILNSIEISAIPEVALAAREDLADSAERLAEIMSLYR